MIGMQYKIILPDNYDMEQIRSRVRENGKKMDGFEGLCFKAYLITEKDKRGILYHSYSPLYVWNHSQGMNHFIFNGYYDNILQSFGWQWIQIGVPLTIHLKNDLFKSKYVVEYEGRIPKTNSLTDTTFIESHSFVKNEQVCLGHVLIYNPEQWRYSHFSFYETQPEIEIETNLTVYEVLHISQ